MRIALTGGIACGKSLAARVLNEAGVETVDADDVVHALIPAEERKRLAAIVFADPAARKELEARIHPQVRAKIDETLAAAKGMCVAVIPLLFETGWNRDYDIVCTIAASHEVQVRRMMATRGYTEAEAEARIAAQMPVEEKAARADYVIWNNGTAEELKAEVLKFVAWLRGRPT